MKQKIPFKAVILPITLTVILLIMSAIYFEIPLYLALSIGYLITFLVALKYKNSFKDLLSGSLSGIRSISAIFLILILIGILIAIWTSSGTIDTMVYYGLSFIKPEYLVVISFIISAMVSMLLGTSIGTASSIGIAFVGMAIPMGINPSLIAGAVVSGAFVGDRTSPLSSAAHINAVVTETNYYDNIKELLKTLIPVFIITGLIYLIIGKSIIINDSQTTIVIENAKRELKDFYQLISPILLLPPLTIMILAIFKLPIRYNLFFGILIGLILAYIFQGETLRNLFSYAIFGFKHPNGHLYGGGWNMFNQVLLIIVAGAFYGLMEASNMLSTLLEKLTNNIKNPISVVNNTMVISITSAILSSTQIMGILIPGKVMLKYYKDFNIDKKILNRMISDSGMVISGLIPWNLNAILLGIALHIPVVDYLPYAFLLFILPIYSYIQFRLDFMRKAKDSGRSFTKNHE